MSINIASIDIDQSKFTQENLITLRDRFTEHQFSDDTFARFLIARNNDLDKAIELMQTHVAWRAENWPILKSSCLKEINTGKLYTHGFDKEGHPLMIFRVCKSTPKDRDMVEMGRMVVWSMECALARCPPNKSKVTVLLDRSNFTMENSDIEFLRYFGKIFQDNYPETMCRAIVYPSGFVFYGIWNVVKWLLDPVTAAKVAPVLQLAGVQQFIEDQYIPVSMGGQCEYEFNSEDFPDPYPTSTAASHPDSLSHLPEHPAELPPEAQEQLEGLKDATEPEAEPAAEGEK